MNPITEATLIDYLAGELSAGRRAEVDSALEKDDALRAELRELESLMNEIATQPEAEPSATADARFAAMLEGVRLDTVTEAELGNENAAHSTPGPGYDIRPSKTSGKVRSLAWRVAGIAAAVALVFTAGRFYQEGTSRETEQQLAAHRTLVTEMLELMKSDRTSNRIKATTVTFDLPETDSITTGNLGYLLRNDENANVRLAALEALSRFPHDAGVRNELLAAMRESPPPVVRFELIEALVRMDEKRVLPYLDELIGSDSLPQPVRDAAQMASFKLI
ncbi:hypothetical protein FUA23_03675 [Neolewinella aurantiaca]|uniref:HEAT repeat protein n=1 Tax=Neolewinella aurantiaca TaxID=2602767 RepID=A0A5C7FLL0_9BACT|nr:HEAT repeat domain-containing protein [Neolewinella aurantiaca]TXF90909.1 hypothetical protein FUA23_03675 [Neolewinella aurantiaca]